MTKLEREARNLLRQWCKDCDKDQVKGCDEGDVLACRPALDKFLHIDIIPLRRAVRDLAKRRARKAKPGKKR